MTLEQRMAEMARIIVRAGGGANRLDLRTVTQALQAAARHWRRRS